MFEWLIATTLLQSPAWLPCTQGEKKNSDNAGAGLGGTTVRTAATG